MESQADEFEARVRISREVESKLFPDGMMAKGISNEGFIAECDKRKLLVDAKVRRQMWERGFLPPSFLRMPPFIFAKAFIHALDLFDKFLGDIAKDPGAPTTVNDIHENFGVSLPDLRGIRNSIQHAEDRSKGEHYGRKIDLKEVDKSKIGIEGAVLVNKGLKGNKFGTTMSDGHYGAIDVSVQTIDVLRNTLLEVYSAFEWKGGEMLYPI
ncbi:hypothetical protein [Meridianimarinicoccus sp. MJW13]|uniref:hypothetical protein n=1 Tax=Meridianimarinicoccus sp. MJW13 TaxID=2720031 RepID=UPI0018660CAF|nr:hypothetical protein [Fluviibacterium sp. MJW13]